MYQKSVRDLYVVGAASEAWRLNLEQGRFVKGIDIGLTEVNVCDVNPMHELLAFGGIENCIEFYDPRDRAKISLLNLCDSLSSSPTNEFSRLANRVSGSEISALRFDSDGLTYACGTDSGHVFVYDIRSSQPLMVRDHRYGIPIKDIRLHSPGKILMGCKIMMILEACHQITKVEVMHLMRTFWNRRS